MDILGVLLGTMLGGAIAHLSQSATWRRDEAREARLALRAVRRRIWADAHSWADLQDAIAECRIRMTTVGVATDRIAKLEEAAAACWRDVQENLEHSSPDEVGVSKRLHDWLLTTVAALDEELLRLGRVAVRRKKPLALPEKPERG